MSTSFVIRRIYENSKTIQVNFTISESFEEKRDEGVLQDMQGILIIQVYTYYIYMKIQGVFSIGRI